MPQSKTSRRGIKNYTTTIAVEKTIAEIEVLLTRYGARKILKEYDSNGEITYLTFMAEYMNGFVPIRLPSQPERVVVILNEKAEAGAIPKRFMNDLAQANRIMWRVILDWIDSQMTMIDIGQKSLLQIFMSDVCPVGSKTLFEHWTNDGIQDYWIEDHSKRKLIKCFSMVSPSGKCHYESDGGPCVYCGLTYAENESRREEQNE